MSWVNLKWDWIDFSCIKNFTVEKKLLLNQIPSVPIYIIQYYIHVKNYILNWNCEVDLHIYYFSLKKEATLSTKILISKIYHPLGLLHVSRSQ